MMMVEKREVRATIIDAVSFRSERWPRRRDVLTAARPRSHLIIIVIILDTAQHTLCFGTAYPCFIVSFSSVSLRCVFAGAVAGSGKEGVVCCHAGARPLASMLRPGVRTQLLRRNLTLPQFSFLYIATMLKKASRMPLCTHKACTHRPDDLGVDIEARVFGRAQDTDASRV